MSRTARVVAILAMAAAFGMITPAPAARPSRAEARTTAVLVRYQATVLVSGAHPGPAFQGIGAISGGGGNSRLLIDYPQP